MNIQHVINKLLGMIVFASVMVPTQSGAEPSVAFVFGNHIDTHQITTLKVNNEKPVWLKGDLLILFTGETDPVSGRCITRFSISPNPLITIPVRFRVTDGGQASEPAG